jgi:hypothetical protein
MGSSSDSKTSQETNNTDNRKAASDKGIVAENSTVNATYQDVSASVVQTALQEANKAFGTAGDLARQSVTSSAATAQQALENSRNTVSDLIRSQDSSLQAAERLYSAAATGGATSATETAASIAKIAVIGAAAAIILTRK